MTETEVLAEWGRLHIAWRHAKDALDGVASDHNARREQETWDALVDYVEAHDLNGTKYDPRGEQ